MRFRTRGRTGAGARRGARFLFWSKLGGVFEGSRGRGPFLRTCITACTQHTWPQLRSAVLLLRATSAIHRNCTLRATSATFRTATDTASPKHTRKHARAMSCHLQHCNMSWYGCTVGCRVVLDPRWGLGPKSGCSRVSRVPWVPGGLSLCGRGWVCPPGGSFGVPPGAPRGCSLHPGFSCSVRR